MSGGAIVQAAAADPSIAEVNEPMDLLQGVIGDDTRVFFADALVPELGAALRVTFVAAGDAAEAQSARWQRIG